MYNKVDAYYSLFWLSQSDEDDDDGVEGDDEGDEERPSSAISQRSLYEKFKAQLEQKKLEVIERRSRATSMHGSLLGINDEAVPASRVSSAFTTSSADMGLPDEKGIGKYRHHPCITLSLGGNL